MRSWVTSCQSLTPSSSPILDLSSSGPVIVSMPGDYPGVWVRSGQRQLLEAAGLDVALGVVGRGEQLLGGQTVTREDRHPDRRTQRADGAPDGQQGGAKALREEGRVVGAGLRRDDAELVAAVTDDGVAGPHRDGQRGGHIAEQPV